MAKLNPSECKVVMGMMVKSLVQELTCSSELEWMEHSHCCSIPLPGLPAECVLPARPELCCSLLSVATTKTSFDVWVGVFFVSSKLDHVFYVVFYKSPETCAAVAQPPPSSSWNLFSTSFLVLVGVSPIWGASAGWC